MFKNIVDRVSYLEVYKHLKNCYELNHDTILAHLNVLYQWRGMEPVSSVFLIFAEKVKDDEVDYWHVNSKIIGTEYDSCGLDFTPWAEWLGSAYRIPKDMSEDEFVAHCLYEATFYGFKEEDIKSLYDEICKNVDEVIAELQPYEKELDIQSALS